MDLPTLHVGVTVECQADYSLSADLNISDVAKDEADIACRLLLLLRDMLLFRISFHHYSSLGSLRNSTPGTMYHDLRNGSLDLYAGLLRASPSLLDIASPLLKGHTQRLGFSLLERDVDTFRSFYSEPLRRGPWLCVFACVLGGAGVLHWLHVAERRLGSLVAARRCALECSYVYEFLVAVAACCQTALPICTRLRSRRVAYISLFFFALLLNSFYTSKVVSTLLHQRRTRHTLRMLADSDVECLLLESEADVFDTQYDAETEYFKRKKLKDVIKVDVTTGVDLLRSGRHALFSDYVTIYPEIVATFLPDEICATTEIDVFPETEKYLWAAKHSAFKESLKNGLLVMRERGEVARALRRSLPHSARADCPLASGSHAQVRLAHVTTALVVLAALYALALLILVAECLVFRSRGRVVRRYCN